jgi:putative peptidoglycan lipid II flippase
MKQTVIDEHYLARSFSVTTLSRALGVGSGVLLDALILFYFGLSRETDAYFAALAIPLLVGSTLEIQIPKVLIPFCAKSLRNDEKEAATQVLSNFMSVCAVLLISTSLLSVGLGSIVIPIIVPGFQSEVLSLAVKLGVFLSWIMVLQGVGATFQSILLSHHKYWLVSSSKFVSNTVAILVIVMFHQEVGIYALAIGVLAGGGASFIMIVSASFALGFRYKARLDLNDKRLWQMFKRLLYPLSSHALGECKTLIENFLLSFLGGGSLSALRYACKIVEALVGVTIGSISTSTLPLVSHYAAEKNVEMMKMSILKGIKLSLFVAAPLSIWLIFNGESLVMLLFGRGKFSLTDAGLTSSLMSLMTPYIMMSRLSTIMQAMFYATDDTRIPAISALLTFVINVMVAFMGIKSLGIHVFPIASSAGALCTAIVMSILLHRRFGSLGWKSLGNFGLQFSGVLIVTTFAFMVSVNIQKYVSAETLMKQLIAFMVPTALGVITFIAASFLLGVVHRHTWYGFVRPGRAL